MNQIIDHQGRVPKYVIKGWRLIHQPTGQYVELKSKSNEALRIAREELRKLVGGT